MKKILDNLYIKYMWPHLSNGVYCFNYHRIGDEGKGIFDPNVYSCTAELFEQHVVFYKEAFTVISMEQLIEKIKANQIIDKKYAVITFDDGYVDNYSVAFPILKKHSVPAAFYIVTNYLDDVHIPWWDEIAWLIRNSKNNKIQLGNWLNPINLSKGPISSHIQEALRRIKQDKVMSIESIISELESICLCKIPKNIREKNLFVSWKQVNEMANNGMHIGSHTVNHNILSHLDDNQQENEIIHSKKIIEERTSKSVTTIAYPVGGEYTFNSTTESITKNAGYTIGFSYIKGVIKSFDTLNPFSIKRLPVGKDSSINELKSIILHSYREK
jgi:peptidoglycan/xylan/chitin deacetylase (PgdA/CDA1 family)